MAPDKPRKYVTAGLRGLTTARLSRAGRIIVASGVPLKPKMYNVSCPKCGKIFNGHNQLDPHINECSGLEIKFSRGGYSGDSRTLHRRKLKTAEGRRITSLALMRAGRVTDP